LPRFPGQLHFALEVSKAVGRRGIKEYRAPEALALIAADREHTPLVCPSCGARAIKRSPRRNAQGPPHRGERIGLTCQKCGRHASYIEGGSEPPRDATMDPRVE
jgi:transposase-like protein